MSNAIVATEEVLVALAARASGSAVIQIAEDLRISPTTARRHLDLLVGRGWATSRMGRLRRPCTIYFVTPGGQAAEAASTGF